MNLALGILGFVLVTITVLDIMYTVLAPNGSGMITGRLSHHLWTLARKLAKNKGGSWLLSNIGVFLLLFIVQFWVAVLWVGNALILYTDPEALYNTTTNSFASDFSSQLYFSGYVLSAMGNGDYTPNSEWWKFFTSFISFTGVIFISLSISYLIPVIKAVTNKRSLSLSIIALGKSPLDLLQSYPSRKEAQHLIRELHRLKPLIYELAQQHLAYPIIHYFHSPKRFESTALALANISETLVLLIEITEKHSMMIELKMLREIDTAVTYYLSTLQDGYIHPEAEEPDKPDLAAICHIYPEIDYKTMNVAFNDRSNERKLLHAYVKSDGWSWSDVYENQSEVSIT